MIDLEDTIIADRDFDIGDDIAFHGGVRNSFIYKRKEATYSERCQKSQKIAGVRIHVERVIGLLKNKYTILQDVLSVLLVSHKDKGTSFSTLGKLTVVCASRTNLAPSVVQWFNVI